MKILPIRIYGDPILEKKAAPVKNITGKEIELIEDMFETMYSANGVGLAAPQVGVSKRIIVVDCSLGKNRKEKIALINPEIVFVSPKTVSFSEGCLSVPNVRSVVERMYQIIVRGITPDGAPIEMEVKDLLARVFQHEVDHLDGKLFFHRLPRSELSILLPKLNELKRLNKKR